MPATTTALRSGVASLATLANADLRSLWRTVSTPDQARDALRDVLPALVETYGTAAAALSADWYDESRSVVGAKGSFSAIPAEIGASGALALAGWGASSLYQAEPDWAAAKVLVEGGLQRRIVNGSRLTIMGSALADPAAQGWVRVGAGGCEWCQRYLDGEVHYVEGYDFPAHDHCNCTAVPAFDDDPGFGSPQEASSGDVDSSLADANVGYGTAEGYGSNCGHAVTAFEMRMRGQSVTATAVDQAAVTRGGIDVDDFLSRWRTPNGLTPELIQTRGLRGTQELALSWGEGGRGIVMVQWKRDGGHAFSVYTKGGKTYFVDPQSGKHYAEEVFQRVAVRKAWAVRSDDLTPVRIDDLVKPR